MAGMDGFNAAAEGAVELGVAGAVGAGVEQ